MADPIWLSDNNLSSITLNGSYGSLEIDSLDTFGPGIQAFLITLYSLTALLAFTGNTLVILVEMCGKRSARNLRKFLINLAISDILVGVLSVPFIYTDIMLVTFIMIYNKLTPYKNSHILLFSKYSFQFTAAYTL